MSLSLFDTSKHNQDVISSTGSLILARVDSEEGQFSFVGINLVAAESFTSSTERLEELIAEDSTLIFSGSNLFVLTLDTVGSPLDARR